MRFPDFTTTDIPHEARDQRRFKYSWNASISASNFVQLEFRAIDSRPCEGFAPDDANWGEQDNLANVPRTKQMPMVRALVMSADTEGDR